MSIPENKLPTPQRTDVRAVFLSAIVLFGSVLAAPSKAQERQEIIPPTHSKEVYQPRNTLKPSSTTESGIIVEKAINLICLDRLSDPLGSTPIDEMQARPSMSMSHPRSSAGAVRAERLLPLAKELTISAINRLGKEYQIDDTRLRDAARRVQAVRRIEPDVSLRDNASVTFMDPRTIYFGTIFLASLPSDEGMISVLAHELTHIADGRQDTLAALFRQIGRRAERLTGLQITSRQSEELTADWVGVMAGRAFIERHPNSEPLTRRIGRAVQHNCVEEDETDEDHLSPRNTLRALLALDPDLVNGLMGEKASHSYRNARTNFIACRILETIEADR